MSTKITIHKYDKKLCVHKVTAKFSSWESFSILLMYAKDGMEDYIKKCQESGRTNHGMYAEAVKGVKAIDEALSIEKPDSDGLARRDIQGEIEIDL